VGGVSIPRIFVLHWDDDKQPTLHHPIKLLHRCVVILNMLQRVRTKSPIHLTIPQKAHILNPTREGGETFTLTHLDMFGANIHTDRVEGGYTLEHVCNIPCARAKVRNGVIIKQVSSHHLKEVLSCVESAVHPEAAYVVVLGLNFGVVSIILNTLLI